MRYFRLLMLAGFFGSLAFSYLMYMRIGRIAEGAPAGRITPAAALDNLVSADKTGTLAKLLQAQREQLRRLGNLPGEEPAAPAGQGGGTSLLEASSASSGKRFLTDTGSSRDKVKVSFQQGQKAARGGGAALIDSSGRRYEIERGRP